MLEEGVKFDANEDDDTADNTAEDVAEDATDNAAEEVADNIVEDSIDIAADESAEDVADKVTKEDTPSSSAPLDSGNCKALTEEESLEQFQTIPAVKTITAKTPEERLYIDTSVEQKNNPF